MHPLVAEAMKKAAVAWLSVDGRDPYPVWCAWVDDTLLVVSGPGEQPAPGLAEAAEAVVTARGDHGGAIVSWRATVTALSAGTPEWDELAPALAARRLNSAPAPQLVARWTHSNQVSRLRPADDTVL